MERTLVYGGLFFVALFILNLKLSEVANKSMNFKLGVFFSFMTLLFLAIGGISDEFKKVPIVTLVFVIICFGISLLKIIMKILNGKIDVALFIFIALILACEVYTRIDPYGSFLHLVFDENINLHNVEILLIIVFIILLSVKIFAGIFFKRDLNFLNKKYFEVKDGKGK